LTTKSKLLCGFSPHGVEDNCCIPREMCQLWNIVEGVTPCYHPGTEIEMWSYFSVSQPLGCGRTPWSLKLHLFHLRVKLHLTLDFRVRIYPCYQSKICVCLFFKLQHNFYLKLHGVMCYKHYNKQSLFYLKGILLIPRTEQKRIEKDVLVALDKI
jgi:hypothetical protein